MIYIEHNILQTMSKEPENPFTNQYVRVNTKATSKGILSPDITVKFENADTTTVVRYNKDLEFEVSGTENQNAVERNFEILEEWKQFSKKKGYTTCFDEA